MFKIKQLFCIHRYRQLGGSTIKNERVEDDNLVIEATVFKCRMCKKIIVMETIKKIEKDYYKLDYKIEAEK